MKQPQQITPPPLITMRLPIGNEAPTRFRAALGGFRDEIADFEDAALLVSEITTNAVRHGTPLDDGSIELSLFGLDGGVRFEVRDGGRRAPPIVGPEDAEGGRGLRLLDRIAERWGYYSCTDQVVWFQLGSGTTDLGPRDGIGDAEPEAIARRMTQAALAERWCRVTAVIPAVSSRPVIVGVGAECVGDVEIGTAALPGVTITAEAAGAVDGAAVADLAEHVADWIRRSAPVGARSELLSDLRYTAEVSQLLASSLDYGETLRRIARLAVPTRADWCTINVVESDGTIRRVAVEHADDAMRSHLEQLLEAHPHDPAATSGVPAVIRSGEALLFPEVDDRLLEETANSEEYLAITRSLSIQSCVIVPLTAEGQVLGAASFVSTDRSRIRYDERALEIAVDIGRRAGTAILNARRYADRSRLVGALTATLLPERLPEIAGLSLGVEYRSATGDLDVGGDFYDVVPAGDDVWYVLVGDVQGKGVEAATLIGLARHTLRAAALRDADPTNALLSLNRALLAGPIGRSCSAVCARFERLGGSWRVTVSRAGHQPPIAVLGGEQRIVEPPGVVLGFVDDPQLQPHEMLLGPGDALYLYTDGVLARFAEDEEALRRALASARAAGRDVAADLAGSRDEELGDDIAVVSVTVTKPSS